MSFLRGRNRIFKYIADAVYASERGSVFLTKTPHSTRLAHPIPLDFVTLIMSEDEHK
jgi:hypothetical protein